MVTPLTITQVACVISAALVSWSLRRKKIPKALGIITFGFAWLAVLILTLVLQESLGFKAWILPVVIFGAGSIVEAFLNRSLKRKSYLKSGQE